MLLESRIYNSVEYRLCVVGEYRDKFRQEIIQFKYCGQKHLGRVFGERIYQKLPKDYDLSNYDCLLPIPSRPSSLSDRGYNPVWLIGKRLSELCELPLAGNILEALECSSQMGLSKAERRANIKGNFRLIAPSLVKGKGFLVLDDVFTTGSTLNEVVWTLNTAAPRQLDALVLAKVPLRSHY